jgi:hypothetical protein
VDVYCAVCARKAVIVTVPPVRILTRPDDASTVATDKSFDSYENAPLLSFVALTEKLASP